MNQHTRFNLPICLAVEDDAFFHTDEIIRRYIPEIMGQKAIVVSEQFLIDLYKEKITDISEDFGGAEIISVNNASFDEAVAIAKSKDAVLLGSIGGNTQTSPWYKLPPNKRPEAGLLKIRKELGLFANLRPAVMFPQLKNACPLKDEIVKNGILYL